MKNILFVKTSKAEKKIDVLHDATKLSRAKIAIPYSVNSVHCASQPLARALGIRYAHTCDRSEYRTTMHERAREYSG